MIVVSTALLAGCGAATSPPTATTLPSPTALSSPTTVPQGSPTILPTQTPTASSPLPAPTETAPPSMTATSSPTLAPTRGDEMLSDPIVVQLVAQARADLARRLSLPEESIELKRASAVEWPDTSLGCPQPGFMYAQIITPGYLIVLGANGKEYEYHSDGRRVSLCQK